MLALATGWTPKVIGTVPAWFRAACHWALYVRSIVGNDGLPSTEIPVNGGMGERLAAMKQNAELLPVRSRIYPEDEDV